MAKIKPNILVTQNTHKCNGCKRKTQHVILARKSDWGQDYRMVCLSCHYNDVFSGVPDHNFILVSAKKGQGEYSLKWNDEWTWETDEKDRRKLKRVEIFPNQEK